MWFFSRKKRPCSTTVKPRPRFRPRVEMLEDRTVPTTVAISVADLSIPIPAGGTVMTSIAVSGDGRYEAYTSHASNLVSGDTNGVADVFVYDRQTAQTTRVSV